MKPTPVSYRFLLGVVFLLTLLSYAFALQAPLFFDDLPNLTQNPILRIDGQTFDEWRTAAYSSDAGPLRRPISMLSFAVNHALLGDFTPASLKAVNLLLHLLTGGLVYLLATAVFRAPALREMAGGQRQLAALAATAIWMLHPLHVSTVLYAVQRMAQLSTFFMVMGLWVFLRYRLQWAHRGASSGELMAAALWLFLIGALATYSKENGALLPWLLLVVEVTLFRGAWKGGRLPFLGGISWFAFLVPVALIGLILLFNPELFTNGYRVRDFDLTQRVLTQGRVLWHYLGWLCLPDIRAMGFQHDDIAVSRDLLQPLTTLYALLAWLFALICAFILRHRFPLLLFALLFFLVAHVMESSVLALEMVYEHRNYLPSVGVCLFFAGLLTSPQLWGKRVNPLVPAGGVISILLVLLVLRAQVWSGQLSLARSSVLNHPHSSLANYFYADALQVEYRRGRAMGMGEDDSKILMVAARDHFLRAYELAPADTGALVSLYITDEQYFPGLIEQQGWFSVLERSLRDRVLQASDFASLSVLVAYIVDAGRNEQLVQIERLINDLLVRNPYEVRLLLIKYEYLVSVEAPLQQRIDVLTQAQAVAPDHASVQYLLVEEYGRREDVAAMYEVAKNWLANDRNRRDLPLIKRLFVSPGKSP